MREDKLRITSFLCLVTFQGELLNFMSYYVMIDDLGMFNVMSIFIFSFTILILITDDSSNLLYNILYSNTEDELEEFIQERQFYQYLI